MSIIMITQGYDEVIFLKKNRRGFTVTGEQVNKKHAWIQIEQIVIN